MRPEIPQLAKLMTSTMKKSLATHEPAAFLMQLSIFDPVLAIFRARFRVGDGNNALRASVDCFVARIC